MERDDGELTDFVSTAKGVLQSLVEKHFPAPDRGRVRRLLGGLGGGDPTPAKNGVAQEVKTEKTRKRKPRRAAAKNNFKKRKGSDTSFSGSESEDVDAPGSGDEFKVIN